MLTRLAKRLTKAPTSDSLDTENGNKIQSPESDSFTTQPPKTSTFCMWREHLADGPTKINIKPVSTFPQHLHSVTLDKKTPFVTIRQCTTSRKAFSILDCQGKELVTLDRLSRQLYHSSYSILDRKRNVITVASGTPHAKDVNSYNDQHAADMRVELPFKNLYDNKKWAKLVVHCKSLLEEETVATLGDDGPVVATFSRAPTYDKPFTVTCDGTVDLLVVVIAAISSAYMAQEARVNFAPENERKREAMWKMRGEDAQSRNKRLEYRGNLDGGGGVIPGGVGAGATFSSFV